MTLTVGTAVILSGIPERSYRHGSTSIENSRRVTRPEADRRWGHNPSCRDPTLFRESPYLQPRTQGSSLYRSPTRPEDPIKVKLNAS